MRSTLGKAIIAVIVAAAAFGAAAVYTAFGIDRIEKAHPPAGRFVAVNGGRLHIVELGRSDAPAGWA